MTTPLVDRATLQTFADQLENIIAHVRGHYADESLEEQIAALAKDINGVLPPETIADLLERSPDAFKKLPGRIAAHVAEPKSFRWTILDYEESSDREWRFRMYDRVNRKVLYLVPEVIIPSEVRVWEHNGMLLEHTPNVALSPSAAEPGTPITLEEFKALTANAIVESRGKEGRVVALCTRKGRFLVSEYDGLLTADEAWIALNAVDPREVLLARP